MNGILSMENSTITNVGVPVKASDATNKNYVDTQLVKHSSGLVPAFGTDYNNRSGITVNCTQDYNSQYREWHTFAQGLDNTTNEFCNSH